MDVLLTIHTLRYLYLLYWFSCFGLHLSKNSTYVCKEKRLNPQAHQIIGLCLFGSTKIFSLKLGTNPNRLMPVGLGHTIDWSVRDLPSNACIISFLLFWYISRVSFFPSHDEPPLFRKICGAECLLVIV